MMFPDFIGAFMLLLLWAGVILIIDLALEIQIGRKNHD